jgi:hypothetical protein
MSPLQAGCSPKDNAWVVYLEKDRKAIRIKVAERKWNLRRIFIYKSFRCLQRYKIFFVSGDLLAVVVDLLG